MLKPNNLYCGDYRRILNLIPDGYFDWLFLDFPYGIGEDGSKSKSREYPVKQKNGKLLNVASKNYVGLGWDNQTPEAWVFEECKRISRNQLFFGANYFWDKISGSENFVSPRRIPLIGKPTSIKDFQYPEFLKAHPNNWIVWDKVNGNNDFNDCELIYLNFENKELVSFVLPYMWSGMFQGKSIAQGWVMQGNKKLNQSRIHPTEKAILLLRWLISHFTKRGDLIGDICFGSGSLFLACESLSRRYIGIEKEKSYFRKAEKRLNEFKRQLKLVY